ncbi:hypothetical protein DdX_11095 [Ditylenchus destructor]|uniref:Uncharacterized protein n=1 Tax=Ditylenchus destructor TaxID=166010 RepID=A0AAD4MWQ6_9BILA|nr:hypothetical protein DdX_11095 [Ditylenchus destructor]
MYSIFFSALFTLILISTNICVIDAQMGLPLLGNMGGGGGNGGGMPNMGQLFGQMMGGQQGGGGMPTLAGIPLRR